jgi:hypothetical protein
MAPTLKQIIGDDNKARFSHYRDGNLFYTIEIVDPEQGATSIAQSAIEEVFENPKMLRYQFPISNEEAKGGTFLAEHKAITLMRWIRKALDANTFQRAK